MVGSEAHLADAVGIRGAEPIRVAEPAGGDDLNLQLVLAPGACGARNGLGGWGVGRVWGVGGKSCFFWGVGGGGNQHFTVAVSFCHL